MKQICIWILRVFLLCASAGTSIAADTFTSQESTPYNQLTNSTTFTGDTSVTAGQFQGAVVFGNASKPTLVSTKSIQMKAVFVGAPYVSQAVSYQFGAIIPRPDKDEFGDPLVGMDGEDYWAAEPYNVDQGDDPDTSDIAEADSTTRTGFWYSENANAVYAVKAGVVEITWIGATGSNSKPANYDGSPQSYEIINNIYYPILTEQYVVSGSPVKTAKTIYWTEETFNGPVISIPKSRVGEVRIVYTDDFPESVSTAYSPAGASAQNSLLTDTFWYEVVGNQVSLRAYNEEGRVFVELLGDPVNGVREHLGYEIVDVVKQVAPNDVGIDLGERVTAWADGRDDSGYTPDPVDDINGDSFAYRHTDGDTGELTLYAVGETENLNDYLVYWLEAGEEGIEWPFRYVRYDFNWPTDETQYSHYVRPLVSSEAEAEATAVQLPLDNVPTIQYQDVLSDNSMGAFLNSEYEFYTYLSAANPVHRTLLRYTSDENVAFERVYSWVESILSESEVVVPSTRTGLNPSVLSETTHGGDYKLFNAWDVAVDGNIACVVAFGSDSVSVFNVVDPENPALLATVTDGTSGFTELLGGPRAVVMSGSLVFVAAGSDAAVVIIDISDPTSPKLVAEIDEDSSGNGYFDDPRDLFVSGNQLYVADYGTGVTTSGGLVIFDISDPENPVHQSTTAHNGSDGSNTFVLAGARGVWVEGTTAYVSAYLRHTIQIMDVSNPSTPVYLGKARHNTGEFSAMQFPWGLEVHDGVAYVCSAIGDTLNLIDVSDPADPQLLAMVQNNQDGVSTLDGPNSVTVSGNLAVVASVASSALTFINVSDPTAPGVIATAVDEEGDFTKLKSVRSIAVNGTTAYAASSTDQSLVLLDLVPSLSRSAGGLAGTVAADLSGYDSDNHTLRTGSAGVSFPRLVNETAVIGERISAPLGETITDADGYLPGYVNTPKGTLYNPNAYLDPFSVGFDTARTGVIIPVNTLPDDNQLQVLWFRANDADNTKGFETIYWPEVIGNYTLEWPTVPDEIVLASNDGSGPIASPASTGSIYYQNDSSATGYNPNEEHALMLAGQVYALRDDLNLTDDHNHSSEPYVLLEYTDSDGRTSMRTWKVLREDAENGVTFDYSIDAGTIVQGPLPLTLLEAPINDADVSENTEVGSGTVSGTTFTTAGVAEIMFTTDSGYNPFRPFERYVLQDPDNYSEQVYLYATTGVYPTDGSAASLSGYLTATEPLELRTWSGSALNNPYADQEEVMGYMFDGDSSLSAGSSIVVISDNTDEDVAFETTVKAIGDNWIWINVPDAYVTRSYTESATYPGGSVAVQRYEFDPVMTNANKLLIPKTDASDGAYSDWSIGLTAIPSGLASNLSTETAEFYRGFTLEDRKGNKWVYRGPIDSDLASINEGFQMQYYYKTMEGFYFPEKGDDQPVVGTITPFLRFQDGDGNYVGDAAEAEGQAYAITYRPSWPADVPELHMAETLTSSTRGLPTIRGQSSLEILFQSSLAIDGTESVVLHDPTREKEYELGTTVGGYTLSEIPSSVATQTYQGDTYFPELPPHLSDRFFMDPNRGASGALVLGGQFFDETTGDDYLLLNVLGSKDLTTLQALCPDTDNDYDAWTNAIANLVTSMQMFTESSTTPGTFEVSEELDVFAGSTATVTNEDVAVDSYALTATGPGTGYVSIIAGNGEAFTEETDPVSIHILKVDSGLHDGELKTVESSNPLAEKLTMQQVVDLAGATEEYVFEWKIAAPVNGSAPMVSENEHANLLAAGATWTHAPFTALEDSVSTITATSAGRTESVTLGTVMALGSFDVSSSSFDSTDLAFDFVLNGSIAMDTDDMTPVILNFDTGTSSAVSASGSATKTIAGLSVVPESTTDVPSSYSTLALEEGTWSDTPHSRLYTTFTTDSDADYSELWISLDRDSALGVKVYLNGEQVIAVGFDDDDSVEGTPTGFDTLSEPYSVKTTHLDNGANSGGTLTHTLVVELFSSASAGFSHTLDVQVDAMERIDRTSASDWVALDADKHEDGVRAILGETADVQSLSDNYLIMRYGPDNGSGAADEWSDWTDPQLAEGWIKRVLGGINPFNQRVSDLYDNTVDSDADVLTEAGGRYEGDIALNEDTINDYGLIEIYETILNRGRSLSIDAGINYGPANDALLLAQGYLNDLYMLVGDEAYVDALNPTIGIGTANKTYGEIATSLFSFDGQLATLLEEELALLRGRSDFVSPGVETKPVYNRLFWNYTAGIDSGEVIYALNYNISEDEDGDFDGVVDATDAAAMFPQGHGDAYGHYLTALKGYYALLTDEDFTWVPQTESVDIAGATVLVDYQDEQKFAEAAAAVATVGKRVFDLTWRQDYDADADAEGWEHFEEVSSNTSRSVTSTRYWGMDHWAARTGIGAYVNWVAGNSMLQEEDTDPDHEGIQVIDRSTVTELAELPTIYEDLQTGVDNAAAGLTPLGLAEGSLAFDINPTQVAGGGSGEYNTHFDQIFERAKVSLRNAVTAFDEAQTLHRNLRSEEDELSDLQLDVSQRELAYTNALIEIYGTPYTDDIGPGGTYSTGYEGPDLVHYMYVDAVELSSPGLLEPESTNKTFNLDQQVYTDAFFESVKDDFTFIQTNNLSSSQTDDVDGYAESKHYVTYHLDSHGFFDKPDTWTGQRESPGKLQAAIASIIIARNKAHLALSEHEALKYELDRRIEKFEAMVVARADIAGFNEAKSDIQTIVETAKFAASLATLALDHTKEAVEKTFAISDEAVPDSLIIGFSNGGDTASGGKVAVKASEAAANATLNTFIFELAFGVSALELEQSILTRDLDLNSIAPTELTQAKKEAVFEIDMVLGDLQLSLHGINQRLQELAGAKARYRALVAEGIRVQAEREIFRQRVAARVQGYRVRDVAFRAFRTEKLERYDTLFDLAAQYAFLAAQAFDYETGLLHTDEGQEFIQQIVESRSLGVVRNGEPQFGGSDSGDPGLSSALAKLAAEWQVLKPRLGFNNPDIYGTTTSLRTEAFRVLPDASGDAEWTDVLQEALVDDIMSDADVARQCLQAERGGDQLTPGLIIEFSTSIENGLNLFGRSLAGGDNRFSASTFANKIFSVGVAMEGYVGMSDPTANSSTVGTNSTAEPSALFLDDTALAATPDVYLIPVGVDIMRSPPLGDQSVLRSWAVSDVTIPLPFNLGNSDYSSKALWQSDDSLTEDLFSIRKHQAFRPVSNADVFVNTTNPQLRPSIYTNNRLIGRSIWNTKWKLVIPGHTLLNDPDEGLQRFIDTVSDIKLHFETYSYAGN